MNLSYSSQSAGTDAVVSYIHGESKNAIPETVYSRVRLCLLDTLGAITAGHRIEGSRKATQYAAKTFADGKSTILDGEGKQIQIEGAVLANSVAANALDIDEGHVGADGHPAAIIVPSAIAAAEEEKVTVGELLDAILVGYEIAVRAGQVLPEVTGYHTGTGSWGPIGAAAAVAKIEDLSPETTADALSIAEFNAPQTPILRSVATPGSGMTKDGIGWGGHVGTMAVSMAKEGFDGSGTIFDEPEVKIAEPLDEQYEITKSYYKPYPCCRWIHPGIDAVRSLYEDHEIDPSNISEVRVHTFQNAIELRTTQPESADEAEYSYPFALATVLLKQTFTPEDLTEEAFSNQRVRNLADKVNFVHNEGIENRYDEAWLAKVEIETSERTYMSEVTHPRGSAERPMTDSDHQSKQQSLLDPYLGSGTATELRNIASDRGTEVTELLHYWR